MINVLSRNGEDRITDVMRKASVSGIESPITFGDVFYDENGQMHPTEVQMVKEEDYCIQNSLDYIFDIKRSFNLFKQANLDLEAQ
jgi:hypothetical protein